MRRRLHWSLLYAFAALAGCDAGTHAGTKRSAAPVETAEEAFVAQPAKQETFAAVAKAPARPASSGPDACPEGMALVEGNYCPNVRLNCRKYLDPKGRYEQFRCAEYGASTCLSKERSSLRFCIDREEYTPAGERLPANHQSFATGERTCAGQGKRMCLESEYNFACEGEEMRPYPYGFSRDSSACNADQTDLINAAGRLKDLRAPGGSFARCVSPFGVFDLAGNLEEFVAIDGSSPPRPAMKGAYWQPGRNYCRAAQTAHDRLYRGTETGFRCCADAR